MAPNAFHVFSSAMPGVDAVEARSTRSFPRHTHEQFGIGLILDGAQKSASGRGPVEAGPGDMITVNPGEIHDGEPIGDQGRWWRMLYFDPALLAEAWSDLTQGSCRQFEFAHPVLPKTAAASKLGLLFETVTAPAGDARLRMEELLLSLLANMLDLRCDNGAANATASATYMAKAMIDDAPASDLTLADLAIACRLSRFQLLRGFVAATGFTPHAYLLQKRLDLARRLIARRMSLAQVAAEAGFADQSHMTRVFASRYGFTPGAYAGALRI
jgi:AraC-like DNA-binding protein